MPKLLWISSIWLLVSSSCFNPKYSEGIQCSESSTCPPGLTCGSDHRCWRVPPAPRCGDGIVDTSEVCDDGNNVPGDGCSADCRSNEACGDGVVDTVTGEVCDDGNNVPGDGCSADCRSNEACGNGVVDTVTGEECDDGGDSASCDSDCTFALCGDGYVNQGAGEDCEVGGASASCDADCTTARCGDGYVNPAAGEDCDDGGASASCDADCTHVLCGDGHANPVAGEECDDSNNVAGDGCDARCRAEYCFRLTNTANEDLNSNSWFDSCVDQPGNTVTVRLADAAGVVVYQASGAKIGAWTYDHVTSTAPTGDQYRYDKHDRMITLDNGDHLRISGRYSNNSACGGSQGNGYGIVIYPPTLPAPDNYYHDIKLALFPYRHQVGQNEPRGFGNWSPANEIAWNGGASMHSCHPFFGPGPSLTGFEGTMDIIISP